VAVGEGEIAPTMNSQWFGPIGVEGKRVSEDGVGDGMNGAKDNLKSECQFYITVSSHSYSGLVGLMDKIIKARRDGDPVFISMFSSSKKRRRSGIY